MSYGETERREDATVEDAHEEMYRALSHDLVAWARRGDDERLNGVMSAVADIMLEVGAGRMAEARTLMGKLLAWRDTFYDAELAEARAIKADRTANWTEIRDAARSAFKLDGNQLGAMDGILSRVLGDETVATWLDTYRGLGFEAMLRREATTEELEALRRSPTLGLLLADEREVQQ